ncbi:MAG: hypothetical protein EA425_10695 [Puniceicoccaceae bacterium]|nr:MAG: hypothetical protein EA425_10695 [Puniceicoccaceae bacterium]
MFTFPRVLRHGLAAFFGLPLLFPPALGAEEAPDPEALRSALKERAEALLAGFEPAALPAGFRLAGVLLEPPARAEVRLEADAAARLDDPVWEPLAALLVDEAVDWVREIEGLEVLLVSLRHGESGEWVPVDRALGSGRLPPPPGRSDALGPVIAPAGFPVETPRERPGALAGASVHVSPGHGWYYSSNLGRWATQRGNTHGIIEDHGTGEAVLQFLVPYLRNAGARVHPSRERDFNTHMVNLPHGGAGYQETGVWTTETASGAYGGTQRRALTTAGPATATATFAPAVPAAGHYAVYVWYRPSTGGATTTDARITVRHSGGETLHRQDLNRDGFTWKYLGTYHFEAGQDPERAAVVIDNQSSVAGQRIVAGAVRFGGGMGDVADPASGTISGKPRWEESGRYYAGFMGMPNWTSLGIVNAMPRFAAWNHETWEDGRAVYLSWHTNGANGLARGTETFAYSSAGVGGAFNGVPGGNHLRNAVHQMVVADIRRSWDATWPDRGVKTANFGEINPSNNPHMPAALVEIGFHDNAVDAQFLLDPEFRREMARAVYKGIVRYYYEHVPGFDLPVYLPEPPEAFRVVKNPDGTVTLAWDAPDFGVGLNSLLGHAATGYRVYRSANGHGFDNGTAVGGTTWTVPAPTPGETVYYRVTATNAGGESFPTATLAVMGGATSVSPLLLVQGFDRLDRLQNVVQPDPFGSQPARRGILRQMNTFDYVVPHLRALEAAGFAGGADTADLEALRRGRIDLARYRGIIWMGGMQSRAGALGPNLFAALPDGAEAALTAWLEQGGRLFLTGGDFAWDLGQGGQQAFLQEWLKAEVAGREAGVFEVEAAAGGRFAALESFGLDDGSGGAYRAGPVNRLAPVGGSHPIINYIQSPETTVDDFTTLGGWRQPSFSGQTNADPASSFALTASPVLTAGSAGRLDYVWGGGNFIRLFNSTQPTFAADGDFSLWIYGDASGHEVRLALRDSDSEIWVNAWTVIDFTGWRELAWPSIRDNPGFFWALPGDGVITGPEVALDSIQIRRTTGGPASGSLVFDRAVASSGEGATAGVAGLEYDGGHGVLFLSFPFESVVDAAVRTALMAEAVDFLRPGRATFAAWQAEVFTAAELADPAVSGPWAAPGGDLLPNVVRYAFGLGARETPPPGFPGPVLDDGLLRFERRVEAADVAVVPERSSDLLVWEPVTEGLVVTPSERPGFERVELAPDSGERLFHRLRILWMPPGAP